MPNAKSVVYVSNIGTMLRVVINVHNSLSAVELHSVIMKGPKPGYRRRVGVRRQEGYLAIKYSAICNCMNSS